MKNKVGQNLARTWPGKSLIKVRQKVDEVLMGIGQLLIKSWSVFKAKEVGQNLDKSWTDFEPFKVCQGYANDMPGIQFAELLQLYSNITPDNAKRQLLQFFSNTSPEIEGFSLEKLSQQLPNAYLGNKVFSLNKSGQNQHEIGMERFGKVSVWVRYLQTLKVVQFLGETGMDLHAFCPAIIQVIQPLSFIVHSLIVHNKRVPNGYTKVTPTLHQKCYQLRPNATGFGSFLSLFDIARISVYVVLPDQSL